MRLFYLHMYGGNKLSGINKKIISQSIYLNRIDVDTKLVLVGGLNDINHDYPFIETLKVSKNIMPYPRVIKSIIRQIYARKYIINLLKTLDEKSIIYLRYPLPTFLTPFDLLKRKCKIVLECNSIEVYEYKMKRSYFSYAREILLGEKFRDKSDAIIGVTPEITQYQIARSKNLQKPHMAIGNGIDVTSVPKRKLPSSFIGDKLHLLFVAVIHNAHGLDRLINGLASGSDEGQKVILHIVGNGAELPHLQKLVNYLDISDRVVFHGFLTGKALDLLFDQCHIAVGSLGMHRKGLTQTSELKGREYCARGIPYIIACDDPDFPANFPYILHLPADETHIDVNRVIAFAKEVCADPDHPQKMRHYAEEHLDWSVKMKNLKAFLQILIRT